MKDQTFVTENEVEEVDEEEVEITVKTNSLIQEINRKQAEDFEAATGFLNDLLGI